MTRPRLELRAFAALTLLAGTLSAPAAWPAAAKPPAEQPPLETLLVAAESTPTERLLDGTVEAVNQATVSAQTAGRVIEVLFDVNDVVPGRRADRPHPQHRAGGWALAGAGRAQGGDGARGRGAVPLRAHP